MGNSTQIEMFPLYPKIILKEQVDAIIRQDAAEHGVDYYSGYWGPKEDGITYLDKVVTSSHDAHVAVCTQSSCATEKLAAVKIKLVPSSLKEKVSMSTSARIIFDKSAKKESLQKEKNTLVAGYLEDRKSVRNTVTCNKCKSHTKTEDVTVSKKCPKCNATYFFLSQTEKKRIDILIGKISTLSADITKRNKKEDAKKVKPLDVLNAKISKIESLWDRARMDSRKTLKTSGFTTCKFCSSKINMGKIENDDKDQCPVCHYSGLQKQNNDDAKSRAFKYKTELIPLLKEWSLMTGIYWVVGGSTKD